MASGPMVVEQVVAPSLVEVGREHALQADAQSVSTRRTTTLRGNMAWTLGGNMVYTGCQWGCSMAIAKLGSAEALGQFSLGLAIAAPLFLACGLQLRGVQATDARRDFSFGHYLTLRIVTTSVALAFVGAFILVAGMTGRCALTTCLVIGLVGLAKAVEAISDIFFGFMQQHEQMRTIAVSSIAKGGLSLFLMIASLAATGDIVIATGALLLSWALVLMVRDIPQGVCLHRRFGKGSIRLSLDRNGLEKLFRASLPLGIMVLLISLGPVVPRFMLASSVGLSDLGIYSAITYTMLAGQTIVAAMGQAASPRLSRLFVCGDGHGYRRLLLVLAGIAAMLGIGGVVVAALSGAFLLRMMYAPQYATYADCLVIVMVAATLQYVATIVECGITAARVFREQVAPAAFSLFITGAASWILIPLMGLPGACWALLLGQIATIAGRSFVLWYVFRQMGSGSLSDAPNSSMQEG